MSEDTSLHTLASKSLRMGRVTVGNSSWWMEGISVAGSLWSPLMWRDWNITLGCVNLICVPLCLHVHVCRHMCAYTCVRGHVPTPECIYLTCLGIQNPHPTPRHSPACLALAVTARWDTPRRLLFHTVLYWVDENPLFFKPSLGLRGAHTHTHI